MLIRAARVDDVMAVARVHVRSWQVAYRGLVPDDYLDGMTAEERARRYTFEDADPNRPATMVAVEADIIRGFVTTVPSRDADCAGKGELAALYVDPEAWRRGIGKALIAAGRAKLAGQGFIEAFLWILAGNQRANRFYRADGWEPDGARRTERIGGAPADELRYRRALPPP